MSFLNSSKVIGVTSNTFFTAQVGSEASVHSLFLNNPSAQSETVIIEICQHSTGTSSNVLVKELAPSEFFTMPKPLDLAELDSIKLSSSGPASVCTMSIYSQTLVGTNTSVSLNPRGHWSSTATYNRLDMVDLNGSSYVSLENNVSTQPPGTSWGLIADNSASQTLVQDQTPQLGGDLDLNGRHILGINQEMDGACFSKTMSENEDYDFFLTKAINPANVIVQKELPQVGLNNDDWDLFADSQIFDRHNSSKASEIVISGRTGDVTVTLSDNSFSWGSSDVGKNLEVSSGVLLIESVSGQVAQGTVIEKIPDFVDLTIPIGDWGLYNSRIINNKAEISGGTKPSNYAIRLIDCERYSSSRGNAQIYSGASGTFTTVYLSPQIGTTWKLFASRSTSELIECVSPELHYYDSYNSLYPATVPEVDAITHNTSDPCFLSQSPRFNQHLEFSHDGYFLFTQDSSNHLIRYSLNVPFSIASIDSVMTFSNVYKASFSQEGSRAFVWAASGTSFDYYSLTTPYNLNTKTLISNYSANINNIQNIVGMAVDDEGSNLGMVIYNTGGSYYFYIYAVPKSFDFSTLTAIVSQGLSTIANTQFHCDTSQFIIPVGTGAYYFGKNDSQFYSNHSEEPNTSLCVCFNPAKTKRFELRASDVKEYDNASGSLSFTLDISGSVSNPLSMSITHDGNYLIIAEPLGITQYSFAKPYDLSSISLGSSKFLDLGAYNISSIDAKLLNGCLYVLDNSGKVYQLDVPNGDVSQVVFSTEHIFDTGYTPVSFDIKESGSHIVFVENTTSTILKTYFFRTSFDITSLDLLRQYNTYGGTVLTQSNVSQDYRNYKIVRYDSSYRSCYITTSVNKLITIKFNYPKTYGRPFVSAPYFASYSQPHSSYSTGTIQFSKDGLFLYIGNCVNTSSAFSLVQYSLDVPFDLESISSVYSVTVQSLNDIRYYWLNFDGTKLYIYNKVYDLSTPFDISTKSNEQSCTTRSFSGVHYNQDGTKALSSSYTTIYDVDPETFEILGTTNLTDFGISGGSYSPISINAKGDSIYLTLVKGKIIEFGMAVPWDTSSIYLKRISTIGGWFGYGSLYGSTFTSDGSKLVGAYVQAPSSGHSGYGRPWELDLHESVSQGEYYLGKASIFTNSGAQINTNLWVDINSISASFTTNGYSSQDIYLALSMDDSESYIIFRHEKSARTVIRNNSEVWEYNSNSDYDSETFTAASENNKYSAIEEAMSVGANKLSLSELQSLSDIDWGEIGIKLDLALVFSNSDLSSSPRFESLQMNYDAQNKFGQAIIGEDYTFDQYTDTKITFTALSAENFKVRVI